MSRRRKALAALLVTVAAVALLARNWSPSTALQRIGERARRSVAVITVDRQVGGPLRGTAFAVSPHFLVTNHHLIAGGTGISVRLATGATFSGATVVAQDSDRDLAVIRIEGAKLQPLTLADDGPVKQGSRVYVIGHPEGLEYTLSEGIVSAERQLASVSALQITAPISSGSSGGPVLNDRGQVVGVSALYLSTGQNLNFAVAARHVAEILSSLDPNATGIPLEQVVHEPLAPRLQIESGAYELGYSVAGRGESLAVYIEGTRDSLIVSIGPAAEHVPPPFRVALAATARLPLDVQIPGTEWVLEIREQPTPELFSGDLVVRQRGSTRRYPYTALRRGSRIGSEALILVTGALDFRATDVLELGNISKAGEMLWRDAGGLTGLGTFRASRPTSGSSESRYDSAYAWIDTDTVRLRWGDLSCVIPYRDWPATAGTCWTAKQWFGFRSVKTELAVDRSIWGAVNERTAGLWSAELDRDGDVRLLLWEAQHSDSLTVASGTRAWSVRQRSLSARGDSAPVPWPPGLLPRTHGWADDHRRTGLFALDSARYVESRDGVWDTIPSAAAAVSEVLRRPPYLSSAQPLRNQGWLVTIDNNLCGIRRRFFHRGGPDTLPKCRSQVVLFDVAEPGWKVLDGSSSGADTLDLSVVGVLPDGRGVLHAFEGPHFISDSVRVQRTEHPVSAEPGVRLHTTYFEGVIEDGEFLSLVTYCPRGNQQCGIDTSLRREIRAWRPGSKSRVIVADSTGLLNGTLMRGSEGRVYWFSYHDQTLRPLHMWGEDRKLHAPGRLYGTRIAAILEDSLTQRTIAVSELGEVETVFFPPPTARTGPNPLSRFLRWLADKW